jgi:hypothetical protein
MELILALGIGTIPMRSESSSIDRQGESFMKILLAAVLATVIAAPCMAASENQSEDKTSGDVLTPGVNEPRVPDTLKPGANQRIRTEGRAGESSAVEGKAPAAKMERRIDEKADQGDKK